MNSLKDRDKFSRSQSNSENKMPLLFIGHGSPMNAIEENEFSRGWQLIGKELLRPKAILCISAHWETNGTFVTAMENPRTIYDFYGFPKELYEVEYKAKGNLSLAEKIKSIITKNEVQLDHSWGFDHGCWSILKHIYPQADIPVLQLSLDHSKSTQWHYDFAGGLSELRKEGILIIGSGNIVHNLGILDWKDLNSKYDWAIEINEKIKSNILNDNHSALINYSSLGESASKAIPTNEHFIPLLYILALKKENEQIEFFNDKIIMGSLSMTSLKIG